MNIEQMKILFSSHSALAHKFAQRTQDYGRANNMFFDKKIIYSWGHHFPIAKFVDDKKGEAVVLFTKQKYSSSTGKHINHTFEALTGYKNYNLWDIENIDNAKKLTCIEIKKLLEMLGRARKPQLYIGLILNEIKDLKDSLEILGIRLYKKNYPLLYDLFNKGENYFDKSLLQKLKDLKKAEKLRKQRKAELYLKAWRNFEISYLYGGSKTYLRYNKDTKLVETSKNVTMTVFEAKAMFRAWNNGSLQGLYILSDNYYIDKVTNDYMIVGCHIIDYNEAKRLINSLPK